MNCLELSFKHEEYRKYTNFKKFDDTFDMYTKVQIPQFIAVAHSRFYRQVKCLTLKFGDEETEILTDRLFYPLNRALSFTLGQRWEKRVPNLTPDNSIYNSPGFAEVMLMKVPALFGGHDITSYNRKPMSKPTNIVCRLLLEKKNALPMRDTDIFPLGFSYVYELTTFMLEKGMISKSVENEVRQWVMSWDATIDATMEEIRHVIATGGSYVPMFNKIQKQREFQGWINLFFKQCWVQVSIMRKKKIKIVTELSGPYDQIGQVYTAFMIAIDISKESRDIQTPDGFQDLGDGTNCKVGVQTRIQIWRNRKNNGKNLRIFLREMDRSWMMG